MREMVEMELRDGFLFLTDKSGKMFFEIKLNSPYANSKERKLYKRLHEKKSTRLELVLFYY